VRRSHRIISSSYSQQATFKQSFVRCRRSSRGAATCRTHLVLAPADVAWKSRALRIVFCDPRWVPQPNAAVTLRARFTASRVTRVRGRGERDARGRRPRLSVGVRRRRRNLLRVVKTFPVRCQIGAGVHCRAERLGGRRRSNRRGSAPSSYRFAVRGVYGCGHRLQPGAPSRLARPAPCAESGLSPLSKDAPLGPDRVGTKLPLPSRATVQNTLLPRKHCARGIMPSAGLCRVEVKQQGDARRGVES
jgi:hypothetical protein